MAYAQNTYVASAGQTDFTAPPYRKTDEIKVYKNGVLTSAWSWHTSSVIRLNTGAAAGDIIRVQRETSRTAPDVTFISGAPIKASDLNEQATQNFQNIQELWDAVGERLSTTYDGNWSLEGKRLQNVGDPIDPQDAATKHYLETNFTADLNAAVASAQASATAAAASKTAAETAETNAELAETNAEAAEAKAQKWADEAEDVEVETGKYSAKHHAAKAGASAAEAAGYAAGVNLPGIGSGDAGKILSVNTAGTGYSLAQSAPSSGDALVYNGSLWVPGHMAYRRNLIINGDMRVWQRGLSFISPAHGATLTDRWKIANTTDGTINVTRVTTEGIEHVFALSCTVTTPDAAIGADQIAGIVTSLEGFDVHPLLNSQFTLSFWVYSSIPGVYCVAVRTGDPINKSYVAEFTINTANTWERKIIIFPSLVGAVAVAQNKGFQLVFSLAAGSTYQTTAGTWQTGDFVATPNQTNLFTAINNKFRLTGVQLEAGNIATPFEYRLIGLETSLCQRYYEFGFASGTAASTFFFLTVRFNTTKRIEVPIKFYSTGSGLANYIYVFNNGLDIAAASIMGNAGGFDYAQSGLTDGFTYRFKWEADAEFPL